MAAYAICDECDREYRLADSMAGQLIRCKGCGSDVEVPQRRSDRARPAPRLTRETPSLRPRRSTPARPRRSRTSQGSRRQADRQSGGFSFWHIRLIVGGVAALIMIIGTALGVIEPRDRGSQSPRPSSNQWNPPASSTRSPFGDSAMQPDIGAPRSASDALAQQMEASQRRMEASQRRMDEAAARAQREMDELRRSAFPNSSSFPQGFDDPIGGSSSPGTGSRFGPGGGSSIGPDFGWSGFPSAGSRSGMGGRSAFPSSRSGIPSGYPGR